MPRTSHHHARKPLNACDMMILRILRFFKFDKASHIHKRKLSNMAEMKVMANPATKSCELMASIFRMDNTLIVFIGAYSGENCNFI